MGIRIERLRLALLAGAGLLVAVLAVLIGSAHYVRRHLVRRLPEKLGLHVKSDSSGVTISKSKGGNTLYLIRASRQVEADDGKVMLHGVEMTLYGQRHDREDHISGDDFEWDPKAGVLRAMGVVHIDLEAPQGGAAKPADTEDAGAKVLHATTSGLVYMEKLGVAATKEEIDFQLGSLSGQAKGADYNSDDDELLLHSDVRVKGIAGGRPVSLTADSADLRNRERKTLLTRARYVSLGEAAEAQRATVVTRGDGSIESVEAEGKVRLEDEDAHVAAERADVRMNAKGQAESAVLNGGVRYAVDEPLLERRGEGETAEFAFDDAGRVRRAVFTGGVHLTERTRATENGREPWSVRDLTAARVESEFVPAGAKRSEIEDAGATGDARLTVVDNGSLARPHGPGRTDLAGDELRAHMADAGKGGGAVELETVSARGHTMVRQVREDGVEQVSRGDTLDAKMRPGVGMAKGSLASRGSTASSRAGGRGQAAEMLESAVQQGHVEVTRRRPAKPGAASDMEGDVQQATAERAVYDGGRDRVTLTGGVEVKDAGSEMWADSVELERGSGDARAEGEVRVSYVGSGDGGAAAVKGSAREEEPVHVLAARAEMVHATNTATFYGSAGAAAPGRLVRMWQGGSQVEAPVIEMARAQRRMTARGDGSGAAQVRTLLVSGAEGSGAKARAVEAVRILSKELVYQDGAAKDGAGTAEFTGRVRMVSADGTMTAREATAYLRRASAEAKSSAGMSLGGGVERVVAVGGVSMEQPGRRAAGEKLVYTPDDGTQKDGTANSGAAKAGGGLYVLTGTPGSPVRVVDEEQGTTVAAEARLRRATDAVEFVGVSGAGGRVRTESPVRTAKGGARR